MGKERFSRGQKELEQRNGDRKLHKCADITISIINLTSY